MREVYQKRIDALFFFCLVLTVVTLPFSLKLNSLSIFALVGCWLLRDTPAEKWRMAGNRWLWLFVSFYGIHLAGMLWTSNTSNGLWELERKSSMVVFPIVLATTRPLSADDVRWVMKYFVGSTLLASLVCLGYASYRVFTTGQWTETDPQTLYTTHYFFYDGLAELLIQPMYLSLYVVFSICIVVYLSPSWKRPLPYLIVGYLVVFLFMLSARMMILAFFALVVINIGTHFIARGKFLLGAVVAATTVALLALLISVTPLLRDRFTEVINSSFEFKNDPEANKHLSGQLDDVNMRLAKWYFTIEAGKPTWLFGQGTGDDLDALMQKYRDNNFAEGYVPKYNSHNQYLQTWLGLGIPGLLTMITMFAVPAIHSVRQKNFLHFSLIVLVAMFCLTESVFCRQWGVVFYACFNSLFAFHYQRP